MKKNYAREFWEQCIFESVQAFQYSPETAAENADLLLAEWQKRWLDTGQRRNRWKARRKRSRPVPPSRQLSEVTNS